ncbi:MAG: LysR family transcriptional regulator [Betaproteobacteria bacterium]|jgi:DNA-binding transcriptional LysR family regulator
MDRIDACLLFVRVVETGGFSRAARDLGVTQPTVTRTVAALEARLGGRLLNRNTRRLSLTDLGRLYFDRCKALLEFYEQTENLVHGEEAAPHGRIRLATSVGFGRRVVTPLVFSFMRRYPRIEVDLSLEDNYVDLVAQGMDLAVRMGRLSDSTLGARRLGLNPWAAVASPAYLARRGCPVEPQELARHDVLVYSTVQGGDQLHFSRGGAARVSVAVHGGFRCNNLSSILAAVGSDFGIAALPLYVAAPALAAGHIVTVLQDWTLPSQEIHAVYPSPRLVPSRVRMFVEHLREAFAPDDWYAGFAPTDDADV